MDIKLLTCQYPLPFHCHAFARKRKKGNKKSRFFFFLLYLSVKVVFILKEQQEIEKIGNNIDLTYFYFLARIWQRKKKLFIFQTSKGIYFLLMIMSPWFYFVGDLYSKLRLFQCQMFFISIIPICSERFKIMPILVKHYGIYILAGFIFFILFFSWFYI